MTETLQQKIDARIEELDKQIEQADSECRFVQKHQFEMQRATLTAFVNKALQEFREQIKKLDTMTPIGFKNEYVDVKDVLALIGEQTND